MQAVMFSVLGTPAAKGSAKAFYSAKLKRAFVVADNEPRQKNWNAAVREAASASIGEVTAPPFVDTALRVAMVFRLARPASHWGTGKSAGALRTNAPTRPQKKPDIDKLARCTLDALTGIVFDDDARIVSLEVDKYFAAPGREGVDIYVCEAIDRGVK